MWWFLILTMVFIIVMLWPFVPTISLSNWRKNRHTMYTTKFWCNCSTFLTVIAANKFWVCLELESTISIRQGCLWTSRLWALMGTGTRTCPVLSYGSTAANSVTADWLFWWCELTPLVRWWLSIISCSRSKYNNSVGVRFGHHPIALLTLNEYINIIQTNDTYHDWLATPVWFLILIRYYCIQACKPYIISIIRKILSSSVFKWPFSLHSYWLFTSYDVLNMVSMRVFALFSLYLARLYGIFNTWIFFWRTLLVRFT